MLLHDDGRQPLLARDAADGAQQLFHDDGRQALQRLVQQQQARVEHQRAAHGQHLLLAARELRAQVGLALGQAREHLVHALGRPRARGCARAAGARHGRQVLVHGERLEDVALLRHPADARRRALVRGQPVQHGAPQRHAARMLARGARQRVDQRGLARAVAAQQGQGVAFGQRERNALQHHGLAVARAEAFDAQQFIRHGRPPHGPGTRP